MTDPASDRRARWLLAAGVVVGTGLAAVGLVGSGPVGSGLPPGPDQTPRLLSHILFKRLTLRGYIVSDFASQTEDFLRDVGGWLNAGKIKYREDIVDGLENAPDAFIGLLQGKNFGKLLIKVAERSTSN